MLMDVFVYACRPRGTNATCDELIVQVIDQCVCKRYHELLYYSMILLISTSIYDLEKMRSNKLFATSSDVYMQYFFSVRCV
jgi:hypothetical protein